MSDVARSYTAEMTSSAESTVDSAESVGTALRKAREKRGVSLPQVSRDLCLKEDVLRALESRQYSALPKVPYCFGFVRTYARYLGLEPEEMVRRFKGEIGDIPQPAKLLPPQPIRSGRFPGRAAITFSVLIAAAVYAGWYFYMAQPASVFVPATSADADSPMAPVPLLDADAAKKANEGGTDTATATPGAESAPDGTKSGSTTSGAPGTPAAKPRIVLKATGACWVYIHDQKGKVVFHKTMHRGDEFVVPDQPGDLVLELGNPAAMQIVFNGRVLKPVAGAGQARRVSLDPKDLAKLP
jgi:cytoskeleton protein RodZ